MSTIPRLFGLLTVGTLAGLAFGACSPDGGEGGAGNSSSRAGSSNSGAGNPDASLNGAGNGTGSFSTNGASNFGAGPGSGNGFGSGTRDMDSGCSPIAQEPEKVIVYRDATVTDTLISYDPVALYIMMDRSSSMVGVGGDPMSWTNASKAIRDFVNDPVSAGLEVGLGGFPFLGTLNSTEPCEIGSTCCAGTPCSQPIVPIGPIPQNSQALLDGMRSARPSEFPILFTPTECALRGMIDHCAQHMANTGMQCVAILVTDGNPTQCAGNEIPPNYQPLIDVVTAGHDQGVLTFTLGLPGSNIAFLDQLAEAGGTDCAPNGPGFACDLQGGDNTTFVNTLNSIRNQVVTTEETQVVTEEVIETTLDCQWEIPEAPEDTTFDPKRANLQFTPSGGSAQNFAYVPSEAECGDASDAWYFDNPDDPKEVLVCPATCDVVKSSPGARVDIQLGCERIEKDPT